MAEDVFSEELDQALQSLGAAVENDPRLAEVLHVHWGSGPLEERAVLAAEVSTAAELVDRELPAWTREVSAADARSVLNDGRGRLVFLWCRANAARIDARLSTVLTVALSIPELSEAADLLARRRVIEGPLRDALMCVPLLGTGDQLELPDNEQARARMEILIWEAGASALQIPQLGKWIWDSNETFDALVGNPARGTLRRRVLAARCLEVSVCGMPAMTDPALVGRTLQTLQPLLLHPEPLVWIHAARSFGRLAGTFEPLEGTLLDWVHGESFVLRQRAMTAFASLPANRLSFLAHELDSIINTQDNVDAVLSAVAAATPYLFHERRDLWTHLAERIVRGEGGAQSARALARGLATLWRRGEDRAEIEATFRQLRQMARRAKTDAIDDWRRWIEVIAVTDPVDAAERDPLDIELGLENLMRLAAQYDDAEADARAARFASTLMPTFREARKLVTHAARLRHRAAAINAFEGCARSLALRLWGPMLATRPRGEPLPQPDVSETWELVARTPAELLDYVREQREAAEESETPVDERILIALEVLALKLGGYALDAVGEDSDLGPGRGPTAHDTCLWLRKLEGLVDGSREMPGPLRSALSAIFWRLVDTTRGTALGEVDDVQWLGPFAAWWALVVDRPAVLQQLATALPMIADGALETCCRLADETRAALSSGQPNGQWGPDALKALIELHAQETELAESLAGFASALDNFSRASGPHPKLEAMCVELVLASERLQRALADPVRALHAAVDPPEYDSLEQAATENAPRMATVVARAIRKREISLLEVWFASLGPAVSALVDEAVQTAIGRTPPPPPVPKKKQPTIIEGYELVRPLGEGGVGSVWLCRKQGKDRFFVLKIPKAEAIANATDTEREGILASFVDEARALAGLYHPNVANIIDRGVFEGIPFLVLELLIGADLKEYSTARLMTLFELRQVISETCAGLTALHNAGLVHRDIKPANIWLRLPLKGGQRFDPDQHRDPARKQPLSSVIIDFGMVRAQKVSAEVGGRFVAGTPGYIAPEQVLDPVELDGRADVYSLAATIYNVTTGRTFFDEIEQPRERIIAHMQKDPMETLAPPEGYPAGLLKLFRAATARDWKDRPTPLEFGRAFAELL